ncbi:MAG: glycyl-radical enzyme activating protein [Bradymonadales bacterium]|nr:glycyl-radical enzyme activating protein [Bradymonadales bacterium]
MSEQPTAWIFDIQGHAVHDGPGCRTLVFLSGCSLRCRWCANPEGQLMRPRLMVAANRCADHCTRCLKACPQGAIRLDPLGTPGKRLRFDRSLCDRCDDFPCVTACYHQALSICGRQIRLDDLMRILQRDRSFWGPEGGVTFTGGEPLVQADFLIAALRECHRSWMHTAVETCAQVPTADLLSALDSLDWLLVDLKQMDPARHRQGTGVDNRLILDNLRAVASSGWSGRLVIRLPLIPGYNDDPVNLAATLRFLEEIGAGELEILPLHRLGQSKYEQLGMADPYVDQSPPSQERVEEIRCFFAAGGIACHCGGDRPW